MQLMQNMQGGDEFELGTSWRSFQVAVPNAVREIRDAKILHTRECDADKMKETVKEILEIEGIVNECGQYEQCVYFIEFLQ